MKRIIRWSIALGAVLTGVMMSLALRSWQAPEEPIHAHYDESPGVPDRIRSVGAPVVQTYLSGAVLTVRDAANGQSIDTFEAMVLSEDGRTTALETDGSQLRLSTSLSSTALIEIVSVDYAPLRIPVRDLPRQGSDAYLIPWRDFHVSCVSSDTRQPIDAAQITVSQTGQAGKSTNQSDEAGVAEFRSLTLYATPQTFQSGSAVYPLEVEASAVGFFPRRANFELSVENPLRPLQLALEPTVGLRFIVEERSTKERIGDATIIFRWQTIDRSRPASQLKRTYTDTEGRAELTVHIQAAELELVAYHPDFAPYGKHLFLSDGKESSEVVLSLVRGVSVEGLVLATDGTPVQDVTVDIDPVDTADFSSWMHYAALGELGFVPDVVSTGPDGEFSLPSVAPGAYRVILEHSDYVEAQDNPLLMVAEGNDPWIGVVDEAHTIRGAVYSKNMTPLTGVVITLIRDDASGKIKKGYSKVFDTSEDGSFEASGLVPGPYRAIFKKKGYETYAEELDPTTYDGSAVTLEALASPDDTRDTGMVCLTASETGRTIVMGRISVSLENLSTEEKHQFSDQVDADTVSLENIPLGFYRAVVWIQGYAATVLDEIFVARVCNAPLEINLVRGRSVCIGLSRPPSPKGVLTITGRRLGKLIDRKPLSLASKSAAELCVHLAADEYFAQVEFPSGAMRTARFSVDDSATDATPLVVALRPDVHESQ